MPLKPIKKVMVVGASGTIGVPILAALRSSEHITPSVLSRAESAATFPSGVKVEKVDFTSHSALIEALRGQDALICTLNDEFLGIQVQLIEAAFEAGVRRFIPSEWGSSHIKAPVKELEETSAGKEAILNLLNQKAKEASETGKEFHWTGVNNGLFFDWSLYASFIDISLPPTQTATIWDEGTNIFSATNLSTVASAVVAILTTVESQTRDRFVHIESFAVSQNLVVDALEKTTSGKWETKKTTTEMQLSVAQQSLEAGNFIDAYYRWVRAGLFSGQVGCRFDSTILDNQLLGLPKENMQDVVEKILRGKSI